MKRLTTLIMAILLVTSLIAPIPSLAKKKKKSGQSLTPSEQRVASMSQEDKRRFDSLTKKQQRKIREGRVEVDFNTWMVRLAVGQPFYSVEHDPRFIDYEIVELYTKNVVKSDVQEKRIVDRQTNWPSIHRTTRKETCQVGDYFLLYNRGIVEKIVKAKPKHHGRCVIETSESILPIVNGKPVEPK